MQMSSGNLPLETNLGTIGGNNAKRLEMADDKSCTICVFALPIAL
jgi:hypothetical protein